MKFNFITEWKCNEVEAFAWSATAMFGIMFIVAAFWDSIAGLQINHNQGYGWQQLSVLAILGLFSVWGILVATRWGE